MKVQIIYRNYKPIHKIYESLITNPPDGVMYEVPSVKNGLHIFKFVYRKLRHFSVIKKALNIINDRVFSQTEDSASIDLVHAINIVPPIGKTRLPYVLEAEHAGALTNFVDDSALKSKACSFIRSQRCRAVICTSEAAKKTFRELFGERFSDVASKFQVVYPTLPAIGQLAQDREIIRDDKKINLLFVGEDSYRKGIKELLEAVKKLNASYRDRFNLYVISGDAEVIVHKYNLPNVFIYPPKFSKIEIMQKCFLTADIFVMPTKLDTFGMAVIDALACGTPAVVTKQFALPEIVQDKKNGWLIDIDNPLLDTKLYRTKSDRALLNSDSQDKKLTQNLVEVLNSIINNPQQIESFGREAKKMFVRGKFSITERNKRIKAIYEEAVKTYHVTDNQS